MANFFKRSKKPSKTRKEVAHEIVDQVGENLDDNTSANSVAEEILQEAQDYITGNSDAKRIGELSQEEREKAVELLRAIARVLVDSDKIPNEVAGKFIKSLIQNDSTAVGVAVAQKADFIPDEQLEEIIGMEEVGINDARKIVPGIEDDETRAEIEDRIDLAKLKEIYANCDKFSNDLELIAQLSNILSNHRDSEKFDDIVKKIVAKRVAYCYKSLRAITINRYTDIISPVQMLDSNILEMIKREYKSFEGDSKTSKSFDYENCKMMIIDELAKSIVEQYFEQSPDNRSIIIPESSAIRSFDEEEEERLIDQITKRCNNKGESLREYQIQKIRNQIHGYMRTEEVESLTTALEAIPNPEHRRNFASNFEEILKIIQEFPEEKRLGIISLLTKKTRETRDRLITIIDKKGDEGEKTNPQFPNPEDR